MPDAIVKLKSKLVRARFNVTAVDAVATGAGRFGAIIRVNQRDVNRVVRAPGA